MKTIAIDCRFERTPSGLGRYTREIVSRLVQIDPSSCFVLFVQSGNSPWPVLQCKNVRVVIADFPHYSITEQMYLPRLIRTSRADLFFSPHFNVPLFCPVPYVLTIHDLILHRYPNEASLLRRLGYGILMSNAIRNSRHIITVSDFVRREIMQAYGMKTCSRISVIHEAASGAYFPRPQYEIDALRSSLGFNSNYFLYVGNCKKHKNVRTLLQAFAALTDSDTELVLVTAGKEVQKLGSLPSRVRIFSDLSDDHMAALYSGARAFVTASLYEGFCLPIVEALACGCPVIAWNRAAMPETASGHALLVEPTTLVLTQAMQSPPPARVYRASATWEQAAEATIHILHRAMRS